MRGGVASIAVFRNIAETSAHAYDRRDRAHELQRRAVDVNSRITPDMTVPVLEYTPDMSMFPDLD